MSNKTIFGRSWEAIQRAQQGASSALNDGCLPAGPSVKPKATDKDRELLKLYGPAGLDKMGFYGVLDRLGMYPYISE